MAEKMPDKIWAAPMGDHLGVSFGGYWSEPNANTRAEFIRANLVDDLVKALEEAREALLVFAAFSDKAERFVEHKAKFGGTAIFPVKDFRLAHFRKAVEVVALIDSILPGDTP